MGTRAALLLEKYKTDVGAWGKLIDTFSKAAIEEAKLIMSPTPIDQARAADRRRRRGSGQPGAIAAAADQGGAGDGDEQGGAASSGQQQPELEGAGQMTAPQESRHSKGGAIKLPPPRPLYGLQAELYELLVVDLEAEVTARTKALLRLDKARPRRSSWRTKREKRLRNQLATFAPSLEGFDLDAISLDAPRRPAPAEAARYRWSCQLRRGSPTWRAWSRRRPGASSQVVAGRMRAPRGARRRRVLERARASGQHCLQRRARAADGDRERGKQTDKGRLMDAPQGTPAKAPRREPKAAANEARAKEGALSTAAKAALAAASRDRAAAPGRLGMKESAPTQWRR